MKVKKIICIFTMITMLVALLPSVPAVAYVDSTVRFKRVTSADDLVVGAKYLIVGCHGNETDGYQYYALGDQIFSDPQDSGLRSPAELKDNGDGTLSALAQYSVAVYPLVIKPVQKYIGGEQYNFQTLDGYYLNAFYSTASKTYEFSHDYSKSLPINSGANGVSNWKPIFRKDGTVLFKTSRSFASSNYQQEVSAYIRFFHYQSGSMTNPAFSGGLINDSNIDLDDTALTTADLTEENIPVKTYLYKEVCAHSEANLTHTEAQPSTCSTHGNIEYYYCSNCCGYLKADKTTEIKLADTVLPLAAHAHTTIVPPKEATCTEHGNIAYTKCEDCGKYFEGSSTNTQIDINTIDIPSINHSYADGKCSVCGAEVVTSYFGYNNTGDGSKKIFTAEYNGKIYAMGMPNEKGMAAVEISEEITGVFKASNDTAAFATIEDGSSTTSSDGYTYTPKYIKIGQNYLKNDSGNLKFVCTKENATYWRYEYGYMNDDTDSQKYICLITNDGDPYFSVSNTIDENHIKAYVYYEKCHHEDGLIHSPEVAPTCYTNGMKEYWTCNVCDMYYSDSEGISEIWNKDDLIILALGAKDENDDDFCDYCHKKMPIFTKVTKSDEIVMQNKYILVAQYGDSYYAVAPVGADDKGEKGGLSDDTLLPAVPITMSEDGSTFKYKDADDQNVFIFTTEFAADCSDLDNGEIRYSLQSTVDGMVSSLADDGGHFWMGDAYAKYGYRIRLNDDKTVNLQSVYNEAWADTESGYLRFYSIDGLHRFSILEKDYYNGIGAKYEGASVTETKVYLYRMTENGTVANPLNSEQSINYTLNDASSTKDFTRLTGDTPSASENAAVDLSTISGMSEALTQEAINETLIGYVEDWSTQNIVKLDVDVNISVTDYIEGNEKEGTGSSITFSLTPTMTINDTNTVNIDDSSFNGSKLMNVSIYVGTMESKEIIHIKQDGTKEYFYPSGHAKVESGEAQAFFNLTSSTGNWVTFSVTEFSDVVVSDTESVFSINAYDLKEGLVTVTCAEAGEYTLVFADYEDNKLNNVRLVPQKFNAGVNYVNKPEDIEMYVGDKIFLWENMEAIKPLCEAYTIK